MPPDGRRRRGVCHELQSDRGYGVSVVLEARVGLTHGVAAGLQILSLELRQPQPAFQCTGVNARNAGCVRLVLSREEGRDGRLLLSLKLAAVPFLRLGCICVHLLALQ